MRLALACLATFAALLATPASAGDANAIDGVYTGAYICAQGTTFLELTVDSDQAGEVKAVFRFASGEWNGGQNLTVPPGNFALAASSTAARWPCSATTGSSSLQTTGWSIWTA